MIEDILEVLDRRIDGVFILHRGMDINPSYKIYKTFYCKLYVQLRGHSSPILVLEYSDTLNISSQHVDDGWKIVNKAFMVKLINWILDDGVQQISDTYNGGVTQHSS